MTNNLTTRTSYVTTTDRMRVRPTASFSEPIYGYDLHETTSYNYATSNTANITYNTIKVEFRSQNSEVSTASQTTTALAYTSMTSSARNYYGYRYYSTDLGRWINRDPIGERGGANVYLALKNNSIGNIDILGKCTREPFNYDNMVDLQDKVLGKKIKGLTNSRFNFECACVCLNKERTRWGFKCSIKNIYFTIRIDKNKVGDGYAGVLGHEQLHVLNHLRYTKDLQKAATVCEARTFSSFTTCEIKRKKMRMNQFDLRTTFQKKEEKHNNFNHPVSGDDYKLSYYDGKIDDDLSKENKPRDPSVGNLDAGYKKPTASNLCFK